MSLEAPAMRPERRVEAESDADKKIKQLARMLSIDFRPGVNPTVREFALQGELRKLLAPLGFSMVTSFSGQHPADIERWQSKLSPQDLQSFQKSFWRGDAPEKLIKSLLENEPIKLAPGFYNMADDFQISISYSGAEGGGSEMPFNMCIGFRPNHVEVADRFVLGKRDVSAGNDAAVQRGLAAVQQGMMEGHGEIDLEDVEWIMARPHTGVRGTPGRIALFHREKPAAEKQPAMKQEKAA